jgi:hypothetical protein
LLSQSNPFHQIGGRPLKCPSCGSQIWREGKEGEHFLCGSLNSCGWSVDADAKDLLLSSLVPRLSFTCPKGHTGALALAYTSTEEHLVAVCLNTDLRFKPAYNSQSPDYVDGSGGRCFARCTISWQDLRPKERERILTELHRWEDEEEDSPDTATPDSSFSAGETDNFHTEVSSQHQSRNSSRPSTGNTGRHIPQHPSGFLDPTCPRSNHNETKWMVLNALVRLETQGQQVVYSADGKEYAEWQLKGGLASSLVAETGLSRAAVNGCLRRCLQAKYIQVVGEFTLLRGSRAKVYRVTGKGHAWLGWAQGTGLGKGVTGNG